jgi:hypothetical protein
MKKIEELKKKISALEIDITDLGGLTEKDEYNILAKKAEYLEDLYYELLAYHHQGITRETVN